MPTLCANLIGNTFEYGAADRPVEIELREGTHADGRAGLELSVINVQGPAGAPDPTRVFERYYRAPAAHTPGRLRARAPIWPMFSPSCWGASSFIILRKPTP